MKEMLQQNIEQLLRKGVMSSPSSRSKVSDLPAKKKKLFSPLENSLDIVPLSFGKKNNTLSAW